MYAAVVVCTRWCPPSAWYIWFASNMVHTPYSSGTGSAFKWNMPSSYSPKLYHFQLGLRCCTAFLLCLGIIETGTRIIIDYPSVDIMALVYLRCNHGGGQEVGIWLATSTRLPATGSPPCAGGCVGKWVVRKNFGHMGLVISRTTSALFPTVDGDGISGYSCRVSLLLSNKSIRTLTARVGPSMSGDIVTCIYYPAQPSRDYQETHSRHHLCPASLGKISDVPRSCCCSGKTQVIDDRFRESRWRTPGVMLW